MEQIYTIFYVHGPSYSSVAFDAGSIEEALEHFTAGYGGRYLPVAWCTERTASHGGTRLTGELRLEAMAEGRTFYYDFAKDMYVAVGNEPPKTVIKRASPTPTLDKLENEAEKKEGPVSCTFYDEGWNAAHDGRPFNPKATRSWRDGWNDYQDADPSHKVRLDGEVAEAVRQALTTEPQRAPLDWNKSTPFDPFPGFTVSYDTGQMVEERAHPLSRITSMSHMLGNGIRDEVR